MSDQSETEIEHNLTYLDVLFETFQHNWNNEGLTGKVLVAFLLGVSLTLSLGLVVVGIRGIVGVVL